MSPAARRAGAPRTALVAVLGLALAGGAVACGVPAEPGAAPATSAAPTATTGTPTTPPAAEPAPETATTTGEAAAPADVEGAQQVPAPAAAPVTEVAPERRPVSVEVPSIGVDAPLIDLGIADDGSIEVPSVPEEAGWLDVSSAPGERGPAVIAGHIDSSSGPAVFAELSTLEEGDEIVVHLADGTSVDYTVDGLEQYPKDEFPTARVYGPAPAPVLRLITCGGEFDRGTGHYVDNVVVYAS